MSASIPTTEPTTITRGDTVTWTISLPDYLPADGWTLKYAFVSADDQVLVTATDNGDGTYLVTISASSSQAFEEGVYHWQGWVETGEGETLESYTVSRGQVEVRERFEDQTSGYDARSFAKKTLDAIEAVLEDRATEKDLSYSIAGRSLSKMTLRELQDAREYWLARYKEEVRTEEQDRGTRSDKVLVRFT
jgi:hypothetical protein